MIITKGGLNRIVAGSRPSQDPNWSDYGNYGFPSQQQGGDWPLPPPNGELDARMESLRKLEMGGRRFRSQMFWGESLDLEISLGWINGFLDSIHELTMEHFI